MARTPIFLIPAMVLPVALFLLIGVVMADSMDANPQPAAGGAAALTATDLARFMFVSFATMGTVMPGLFNVGQMLASERDQGLLKLKRAQPVPTGAYMIAKLLMQLIFAALAASAVAITALVTASELNRRCLPCSSRKANEERRPFLQAPFSKHGRNVYNGFYCKFSSGQLALGPWSQAQT